MGRQATVVKAFLGNGASLPSFSSSSTVTMDWTYLLLILLYISDYLLLW